MPRGGVGVEPLELRRQQVALADEGVDALDELFVVLVSEQVDAIDIGALEVVGEDQGRSAGFANNAADVDVAGVLLDDETAHRIARFEMDDIVFPFVLAGR